MAMAFCWATTSMLAWQKLTTNANKPPSEMNVHDESLRHPYRSSHLQILRSDVINDKEIESNGESPQDSTTGNFFSNFQKASSKKGKSKWTTRSPRASQPLKIPNKTKKKEINLTSLTLTLLAPHLN
jgi:hypothetical protein